MKDQLKGSPFKAAVKVQVHFRRLHMVAYGNVLKNKVYNC
jgi:hypothetical protein